MTTKKLEQWGNRHIVTRAFREDMGERADEFVKESFLQSLPEGCVPYGEVTIEWMDSRDDVMRGEDWIDCWVALSTVLVYEEDQA